jgi:hypothetical protein
LLDDPPYFLPRQHDRQPLGANGPHHAGDAAGVDFQHLLVEEEQSTEGLVLGRGTDTADDGQVGQEGVDLGRPHLQGVAFVVEQNEPLDPGDVSLLGAEAVVPQATGGPDPVE